MKSKELIEKVLLQGTRFVGGKERVAAYFAEDHTTKEKANFIKNEYGTGGWTLNGCGSYRWLRHDGKGIELSNLMNDGFYKLKWDKAVSIVERLIEEGRYLDG